MIDDLIIVMFGNISNYKIKQSKWGTW